MPSFSHPSVSNDNLYSESAFRTLKYRPNYPEQPFESLLLARQWVAEFVAPEQRHNGEDIAILKARDDVYQQAKKNTDSRPVNLSMVTSASDGIHMTSCF